MTKPRLEAVQTAPLGQPLGDDGAQEEDQQTQARWQKAGLLKIDAASKRALIGQSALQSLKSGRSHRLGDLAKADARAFMARLILLPALCDGQSAA